MMNWIWPDIDDIDTAKNISHNAAGCAFFVAIVTAVIVYLQTTGRLDIFKGIGAEAYVDAGLFFILGAGLLRKSRIAAIAVLLLYIAEQYYMMKSGMGRGSLVMIIFILVFANSIRATFSHHEFKKEEEERARAAAEAAGTTLPKKNHFLSFILWGMAIAFLFSVVLAAISTGRLQQLNIPVPQMKGFSLPNLPAVKQAIKEDSPSAQKDFAPDDQSVRTFRLKTGEVIRSKVLMEDDVFYTVEVFGGAQKIVIKEDIAES